MEFATGHAVQLGIALILGITLFVAVYALPERVILGVLIVMIPFQIITSRYGSLNMVLTYLVGAALLLKGRIKYRPLLLSIVFILFAYLLSISQVLRATLKDHLFYLVSIGGNFVLFYIVYNYFRQTGDYRYAFKLFMWMNILVILYGVIQLSVGFERFAFLGISEFAFAEQSETKQRLVGTFGAAGVNGEYFALQILFIGYLLMYESRRRIRVFLLMIAMANFGFLVATGSRGSFISFIGGVILFLWIFRKELGVAAISRIAVLGGALFTVTALIVISFTNFNVLFDRLLGTEFEEGFPDTRHAAFEMTVERIPEAFVLGHGPRLKLIEEELRVIPGYVPLGGYPHNLYLFLLYTVGVVGLVAYLGFFGSMYRQFWQAKRYRSDDPLLNGIPRLAIVLLVVFLVDQLKIEFLRFKLNDAQNYLFALWAILLAFSDLLVTKANAKKSESITKMPKNRILRGNSG